MKKTVFTIPKMDCPSEEKLVRLALGRYRDSIVNLSFDIPTRKMEVIHKGDSSAIIDLIKPLNFGIQQDSEITIDDDDFQNPSNEIDESKTLWILLGINFSMFVIEIIMGFVAQSTGLIADSLDMLADAGIYGISLYAVGKSVKLQNSAARLSGYFQGILALSVVFEVVRRYFVGSEPQSSLMVAISLVALVANTGCLALIHKHRKGGAHMKASWIFSSNDVIANVGVILAGVLVSIFNSPVPDLIIGLIISVVVIRGALAILRIKTT